MHGLPDSRTTASANSLREAIMRSQSPCNLAHRSRIGSFAHAPWATRARETISGNSDDGVLAKWASTSPVAGLTEGSVSMGMAVAAISAILTDFEAGRWTWSLQTRSFLFARRADSQHEDDKTSNSGHAESHGRPSRHASSCWTSTITRPCDGTVGPDLERSRSSYKRSMSSGMSFPRPTSSSVPTIFRTI